jgi:RNA polymerase sigma-70 factor (ECF subfamily)
MAGGEAVSVRSGSPAEPPARTDADLVAAHLGGDQEAFGELFVRHEGHLWAAALRVCRNPDDAADALQEGLLRAMRAAGQFQGRAAVGTWLHRIITNAAIDLLRARHPIVCLDELPESPTGPATANQGADTHIDLERAFATLAPEARVSLYLVDYEGWSVAEAAAALGVAPGTIKSRCARARARLVPLLAGYRNRTAPGTVQQPVARTDPPVGTDPGSEHD